MRGEYQVFDSKLQTINAVLNKVEEGQLLNGYSDDTWGRMEKKVRLRRRKSGLPLGGVLVFEIVCEPPHVSFCRFEPILNFVAT